MANRKEYEMLFLLNASLNGNFQGTFSKAQQEFAKLGREVQDLQKLQANVSSYQKQEQAIAATGAKLSSLRQQHGLLQQEISETTGSTSGLEREKLRLEQRIRDTETALERQKQKLDAASRALQEAGIDTKNLTDADAKLAEQLKELQVQQDRAAGSADSFGRQAAQGIEAVQSALVAAGIADALGEIKDAYLECVTIAADFQEGMSNVEALSGATAQEMADLMAQAKELGAETKYTALEASEAMGYMAMAGWDAQQMMSGMSGVIDLAAASGESLAMVSDIVTDNLTAFGLTAADTAHFADVLAAAATNSNTSVSIMGETFKQSASVAGTLGYSIEDIAVATGLMANAGVKGSIGGTALKNTFNGLLEGVTLTSAAFGEYTYSAVKTDGAMKDFAGTIDELRVYFDQMTDAERANNAMAIAGQEGYNGLLAILNATESDYQSLTDSINNCSGAAQKMADIKMDNLNGQLALMNSAWEAVQTTIGEQFNPELRELSETGTDVLNWVNTFVQENPSLVKGVTVAAGAFGVAAVAITGVTAAIRVADAAAAIFAGTMGVAVGPVLAVVAAGAALTGIAYALGDACKVTADESYALTAASREQYEQLESLNDEYERAVEQFGEASYETQSLRWQIDDLTASYESGKQTFEEYQDAHEMVMDSYRDAAAARESASASLDTETAGTDALIGKLAELTSSSAKAAESQDAIRAIVDHLNETLPDLGLNYDSVISGSDGFISSLKEMAQAEAEARRMAQDYENYVNALQQRGVLGSRKDDAAEQVRLAAEDYESALAAYNRAKEPYMRRSAVVSAPEITRTKADMDAAKEQLDTCNTILEETTGPYEENEIALSKLEGKFQAYHAAQEAAANAAPTLEGALASARAQIERLTAAYNEAYAVAEESISGQYSLWDKAADAAAINASAINAALESQITYWEDYNANLASLGERSAGIDGLSEMIASFADGSAESVNAIAGMASASDEDLRTMAANWQELQKQQSETAGSLAELVAGFPEQLEQMAAAMEDGVEGMSMPDEAGESARNTIQAFINEAETMLPAVQDAYALLGKAAADSLEIDLTKTSGGAGNAAWATSLTPGPAKYTDSAWYANNGRGFASGTQNAPPGWAWVGEEGPELMRMHGGEQILPADISEQFAYLTSYYNNVAAYAGGTGSVSGWVEASNTAYATYQNTVSTYGKSVSNTVSYGNSVVNTAAAIEAIPAIGGGASSVIVEIHIHLEGNAAPETVQALEDYVRRGELRDVITGVMEDIQTDARRGAYG